MKLQLGDVCYAHFPLEENNSKYIDRPVIIVVAEEPEVTIIKVTKTAPRKNDPYDVPIQHFKDAGLKYPSTARVSKVITVDDSQILSKVGQLHVDDLEKIIQKLIEFSSQ
jgi:mRNA-degrading endonuclease toxin of MazEF toxin-antitoxin module